MRKSCAVIGVLLVLLAFGTVVFAHAGDLPPIALTGEGGSDKTVPVVSTEFEVPITMFPTAEALELDASFLSLIYRKTAKLTANADVVWSSSNERIVRVDAEGNLRAVGRGFATVTATRADGAQASCSVEVRYTFWQWIVRILLFGWIWY